MKWDGYKQVVQGSREVIVFPFFEKSMRGTTGVCLDVGCGSGDLTCFIAKSLGVQIIGIDNDLSTSNQDHCFKYSVHLIKGDLEKNAVLDAGVTFDCAFSNCCFNHLDDDTLLNVLVDIRNSLKLNSRLIFLVPSIEWAKEMYSDPIYVASGITAIPRYGGRQYFRTRAWYATALERAGFNEVQFEQITIPDSDNLEPRYRARVGASLFTSFSAHVAKIDAETLDATKKAFDVAHDNRKFEIQLFWQRSLFFWGFVAAALVGYTTSLKDAPQLAIIFALFGLVCSIVWSRGNRGSKYWQEYWERKVNCFQHKVTGNIFYDRKPTTPHFFQVFEGRRASVSKLTMALSDFTVFLWSMLCARTLIGTEFMKAHQDIIAKSLVLVALFYCLFFLRSSKSED